MSKVVRKAQMRVGKRQLYAISALLVVYLLCGCFSASDTGSKMSTIDKPRLSVSPNAAILDEVNRAGTWFHAKKVRSIRARKLEYDETVQTLEGPVEAKSGAYLCRGEAGEPWPQSAKSLHERYVETNEVDSEGWRLFTPRPDTEGVLAARIDHPFSVEATWGTLQGKAGDYVVKQFADRDVPNPKDVWIVDSTLFEATYQRE